MNDLIYAVIALTTKLKNKVIVEDIQTHFIAKNIKTPEKMIPAFRDLLNHDLSNNLLTALKLIFSKEFINAIINFSTKRDDIFHKQIFHLLYVIYSFHKIFISASDTKKKLIPVLKKSMNYFYDLTKIIYNSAKNKKELDELKNQLVITAVIK